MFKKMLVRLGLRKAPTPVRTYLMVSSVAGGIPAALLLAYKYRRKIAPMLRRASSRTDEALQPAL